MVLLAVLLVMQLVRPQKNKSPIPAGKVFVDTFKVDERVNTILAVSCYDCHSNSTAYPWYSEIQPVGWLMARHVNDGREKLNFDELPGYGPRRIRSKFTQIIRQVEADEMPLDSYLWIHGNARLDEEERRALLDYFNSKLNP